MSTVFLCMTSNKGVDLIRGRIADNLKRLRMEKNYSQQYVSEYMGKTDYTGYQRLESGKTELKLEDAAQLAQLYKVSIERIWNPEYEEPKPQQVGEPPYVPAYSSASKMQLQLELDGSEETLKKQVELLTSINEVLKKR
jgi:transcriptional regulator with XRE-family HTH domain